MSESHESLALLHEVLAIEGGAGALGRKRVRVALQRHCKIAELTAAHLLQHDLVTAAEVPDNAPIARGTDEAVGEFTCDQKRAPTPAETRVIEVRVIIFVLKTEAADAVVSSGKLAAEGAALAEAFQAADAVRKTSEDAAKADGADMNAVDAAVKPEPEIPRVA